MSKNRLITPEEFMQDISSIVEKYNAEMIARDKAEKESLYPGLLMTSILNDSGLKDSTDERKQDGP
jgi:hypothetical protein